MIGILEAKYVSGYRIWLAFNTGESGEVDLTDVVQAFPAASALKDIEKFKDFSLDEWPTLVWSTGFDLSPEMLFERATGKQVAWMHSAEQAPLLRHQNA